MKRFNHFRIELPSGPIVELLRCRVVRLAATIDTIARDCVERVGDGKDARANIDIFAA